MLLKKSRLPAHVSTGRNAASVRHGASKAAIFSAQRAAQNKPAKYDMVCESQGTKK